MADIKSKYEVQHHRDNFCGSVLYGASGNRIVYITALPMQLVAFNI